MLTVVIKRSEEPKVIQLTVENVVRELGGIVGAEMLLEDNWIDGLRKVRTPYVCLVEADCTLSSSYMTSNFGLMQKTHGSGAYRGGGYMKLAMIASCLGVNKFDNRVYNYRVEKVLENNHNAQVYGYHPRPFRDKRDMKVYEVQIGFVPGAIMRVASIRETFGALEPISWDEPNLVKLSTEVSYYLWNTGRRIQVNPNTTYVSTYSHLENPMLFKTDIPDRVANIFTREGI